MTSYSYFRLPESVETCPECGGQLGIQITWFEDGADERITDDEQIDVSCIADDEQVSAMEKDENIDDELIESYRHRWYQSDWQPVIDHITGWCIGNVTKVSHPPELQS